MAKNGFEGGKQNYCNDPVRKIKIQSFEEVLVTATFKMISLGATKIKLISPKLDGWQSEWC